MNTGNTQLPEFIVVGDEKFHTMSCRTCQLNTVGLLNPGLGANARVEIGSPLIKWHDGRSIS